MERQTKQDELITLNKLRRNRNRVVIPVTFAIDKGVIEELKKLLPKNKRSEFVNQVLRENLMSPIDYARQMKKYHAQVCNFWDYEINRLETEAVFKKEKQQRLDDGSMQRML